METINWFKDDPCWDFLFDGNRWSHYNGKNHFHVCPSQEYIGFWDYWSIDLEVSSEARSILPASPPFVKMILDDAGLPMDSSKWASSFVNPVMPDKKAPVKTLPPSVYFLRAGDFVKIGWASDPLTRIKTFEIGCPHKLELLATVPGGFREEGEFHRQFESLHERGEWFRFEGELKKFILTLTA